ncbi:MAG: M20 family metallopeptidase [Hyphomicrobiales bacterium]|nr:M20 family metallopeptidase [Hyphomicrobiales bacterium]
MTAADTGPDPHRLVATLAELVACNSENPPGREVEAAHYVAVALSGVGLTVAWQEFAQGRPNIAARFDNGAGPVFAFNSHLDVVPAGSGWSGDPFRLRRANGRLIGRGACDAKGAIAGMVEAVRMLCAMRERWSGTLLAVFVADEEVASRGARRFVAERPQIDLCLVGEPTSNTVVIAHKGSMRPLVRVHGVPAHSASPDRGDNALYRAARLLLMIEDEHRALSGVSHPLLGSPSLTVTRMAGGHADNVVPESCDLLLDRRMIPGESEHRVQARFEALLREAKSRHGVEAEIVDYRPTTGGATETDASEPVVRCALAAAQRHGVQDLAVHGLQGACDLVHFRSIGAQGIVLGPGTLDVAHKPDEYVPEDELIASSLIYRDTVLALMRREGALLPG